MSNIAMIIAAAQSEGVTTHGATMQAFQPTAARCSSSSSSCCVACVKLK